MKGSFANFRILIRKDDGSNLKDPVQHGDNKEEKDFFLDILNKPELSEWSEVEIEIKDSDKISTDNPNAIDEQTKNRDSEKNDSHHEFQKIEFRTDEPSRKGNEESNMMIIRLLSPIQIFIEPDFEHATANKTGKVSIFVEIQVI